MTSVVRRREREHDDSGEYSDASQDNDRSNSLHDGAAIESDYDSAASESETSERDPENQETEKRVDDDEDRSNPQYIPKRGTFYEHDDRTAASGEESANTTSDVASEKKEGSEAAPERRRPPRKSESVNKWSHDKFNENEQMPKSRDELVAIYGYDIRNEDAPPHARRNRRYGRGPNKYTRTWEDEEAYRRQAAQQPRKPPNAEDFPELDAAAKFNRRSRAPRPRSKSQPTSNDSSDRSGQIRRNSSIKTKVKPAVKVKSVKPAGKDKLPALENLTITTVANNNEGPGARRVSSAVAQQRPVPTEQAKKKPTSAQPQQNNAPKPQQVQQKPQQNKPQQQKPQQQPQPPTNAESKAGGSKRYSSLRQRPLAETYSPQQPQATTQQQPPQQPQTTQQNLQPQPAPQPQPSPQPQSQPAQQQPQPTPQTQPTQQNQQHRYHQDYPGNGPTQPQHQGSPVPQLHPQQLMHQQPLNVHRNNVSQPHGPSPPHQALQQQHSQQVRLGILDQAPQMVTHPHHTLHNIPPQQHIVPAAQGYAPPAMMPAQYMQQSGSGAVFGGAPMYAQPAAAYPHQMYQHHNYTQAGGVTYYNCAEQEQPPPQPLRAQRRPTAAIPIVRPHAPHAHAPHTTPNAPTAPDRPANSTEKDNIDRIVENMFVRKPWPAHGSESKDKSQENRSSQEPASKESSEPNSLTSSSISDKPESIQKEADDKAEKVAEDVAESITDA